MNHQNKMHVDNPFESPAVLSICPGFLGLERGLERAIGKIRTLTYVEIEAFIVANLIAGMQAGILDAAPVWTDVKTFNKVAKHFRKKIHGLTAGYPCQPWSLSGKRQGHEDPRHLWPFISDIILTTEPIWCLFENVAGHLSMGYGEVYRDLRDMGYAVEAGIFTAEEVGAPHERERLFILAISEKYLAYSKLGNAESLNQWYDRNQSRRSEIETRGYGNCQSEAMGDANDIARRLSECESGQRWCEPVNSVDIVRAGKELVNANSQSGWPPTKGRLDMERDSLYEGRWDENSNRPQSSSNENLAHATGSGQQEQRTNGIQDEAGNNRTCYSGTTISDTDCFWLQIRKGQPGNHGQEQPTLARVYNQWPAGPGEQQFDWEEPRTVEPRMGSTINGYNFREDLLRAYGNSVVEQCAEVAFLHLLEKHLRNLK